MLIIRVASRYEWPLSFERKLGVRSLFLKFIYNSHCELSYSWDRVNLSCLARSPVHFYATLLGKGQLRLCHRTWLAKISRQRTGKSPDVPKCLRSPSQLCCCCSHLICFFSPRLARHGVGWIFVSLSKERRNKEERRRNCAVVSALSHCPDFPKSCKTYDM